MKKFEGEASASDKKKLQKLRKETMDNLKKFGEASKKYQEKKENKSLLRPKKVGYCIKYND